MRRCLIDILACPVDGNFPLKLIELESRRCPAGKNLAHKYCNYYCAKSGNLISEPKETDLCGQCRNEDIIEGVLVCTGCGRWFTIREGIPYLVRDGLRHQDEDLRFLERHRNHLDASITQYGKPINLTGARIQPAPLNTQFLEEGAYWSEYIKAYYAVGDTSVLDVRSRATHPSFYNLGVLERDDKDRERLYGMWPNHLGRVLFGALASLAPGLALDVGCGGGQFGLEAAYRGWEVAAIDIALGALEVGRDYAGKKGLDVYYVYAEPMNPPFRKGIFNLLMSKDALHHLPNLEAVFQRLDGLLKDKGKILFFEHVGQSPIAAAIKRRANRYLHPKIQRRYPRVEVPEVLRRGSPFEDVGRDEILHLAKKYFHIRTEVKELMLYHQLEFSIYYAFGKRKKFTQFLTWFIRWFIEKPLLLIQKPDYAIIFGEKHTPGK